jgi:hypothetical protein
MPLNLILALFWLIVAIVLFCYPLLDPAGGRLELGSTGTPFAWVAVFFFGFNLVRWRAVRLQKRAREEAKQVPQRRQEKEYNPEFDFEKKE